MKYWQKQETNKTDTMNFWQGKFIEKLEPNEVFVFGANPLLSSYQRCPVYCPKLKLE